MILSYIFYWRKRTH